MVSSSHQALYAARSFDVLFTETAWDSGAPSVTKIFWYQYMDVGAPQSICNLAIGVDISPSGLTSYVVVGAVLEQSQETNDDWWYCLYSGIDWSQGGVITANPVQCIFLRYPIETPGELLACLGLVYLPAVQSGIPAVGE